MKKLLALLLALVMVLSLCACGKADDKSNKYDMANNYMQRNDYAAALPILEELSGYKDCEKMYETCLYELAVEAISSKDFEKSKDYIMPIYKKSDEYQKVMYLTLAYAVLEPTTLIHNYTSQILDFLDKMAQLAISNPYRFTVDSSLKKLENEIEYSKVQLSKAREDYSAFIEDIDCDEKMAQMNTSCLDCIDYMLEITNNFPKTIPLDFLEDYGDEIINHIDNFAKAREDLLNSL